MTRTHPATAGPSSQQFEMNSAGRTMAMHSTHGPTFGGAFAACHKVNGAGYIDAQAVGPDPSLQALTC